MVEEFIVHFKICYQAGTIQSDEEKMIKNKWNKNHIIFPKVNFNIEFNNIWQMKKCLLQGKKNIVNIFLYETEESHPKIGWNSSDNDTYDFFYVYVNFSHCNLCEEE
jgi:hypothetical protein